MEEAVVFGSETCLLKMNALRNIRDPNRSLFRRWTLSFVVGAAMLGWGWSLVSSRLAGGILLPFAWRDVAAVHIACGLPIAWMLRQWFWRSRFAAKQSVAADLIIGASLLAGFRLLFWSEVDGDAPTEMLVRSNTVTRAAASLVAAFGIVSLASVWDAAGKRGSASDAFPLQGSHWLCGCLVVLLVPTVYELARCQSETKRAFEYVEQSRLGEAAELLRHCLVLRPHLQHEGQEIQLSLQSLAAAIERVRLQTKSSLPREASESQQIRRAVQFAILGQRDRAIALLQPLSDSNSFAFNGGDELLGTLYQDRRDWKQSIAHFHRAADAWSVAPESTTRQSHLAKSIQGVAFGLRKQGEVEQAATAYRKLLQVAPTAETHFLLAQFYEDIQETARATRHVRLAIELSPEQYASAGQQLLAKMQANHFGCFQLLRD